MWCTGRKLQLSWFLRQCSSPTNGLSPSLIAMYYRTWSNMLPFRNQPSMLYKAILLLNQYFHGLLVLEMPVFLVLPKYWNVIFRSRPRSWSPLHLHNYVSAESLRICKWNCSKYSLIMLFIFCLFSEDIFRTPDHEADKKSETWLLSGEPLLLLNAQLTNLLADCYSSTAAMGRNISKGADASASLLPDTPPS